MTTTVLYYPWMVPPESWVKRSLLLFDEVASMVPWNYEDEDPLLEYLHRERLWRSMTPAVLSQDRLFKESAYYDEIGCMLENYRAKREPRAILTPPARLQAVGIAGLRYQPANRWVQIHLGKLDKGIETTLQGSGVANYDEETRTWSVDADVAELVLSITARHIADAATAFGRRTVVSTDSVLAHDSAFAPLAPLDRDACWTVLMDCVIPAFGRDVSIEEVVRFRDKHRDAVMDFRVTLNDFTARVAASPDPTTTLNDCIDALLAARQRVVSAAEASEIQLRRAKVIAVVGIVAAAAAGPIEIGPLAAWAFQGIGITIGAELMRRAAARPREADPMALLYELEGRFARSGVVERNEFPDEGA